MDNDSTHEPRQRLKWLGTVMIRPRATMRRVLDSLPDDLAIPLIVLATFSQFIVDEDYTHLAAALDAVSAPVGGLIIVGVVALAGGLTIALFYVFSLLVAQIGRLLGGSGTAQRVRSGLAWGTVPFAWALLFRAPARALGGEPLITAVYSRGNGASLLDSLNPDAGFFFPILTLVLLEAAAAIWYLVLSSKCVGEAHRFSAWRGLASLVLGIFIPLIALLITVITAGVVLSSLAS
jgi:hypothetical protein